MVKIKKYRIDRGNCLNTGEYKVLHVAHVI